MAGDFTADWLALPVPAVAGKHRTGEMPPNWELYPGTRMVARPGGAWLLSRLVQRATGADTFTHALPPQLENIPPNEIIHSIVELDRFPPPSTGTDADRDFWCILKQLSGTQLEDVAYDIVVLGEVGALTDVPFGRFGDLKTVDRAEIESFRSIRNLIRNYLADENPKRPLSIAVFGPPGSGKSFGVTAVALSIAQDKVKRLEFNVAQFTSPTDLAVAFHKVRDTRLEGKIPIVFLDEFDSKLGESELGWLKYFLAPMQDGTFKDGEAMHPIGKAILVFAGGTKNTYQEFCYEDRQESQASKAEMRAPDTRQVAAPNVSEPTGSEPIHESSGRWVDQKTTGRQEVQETVEPPLAFKEAKGPDFVSRLRGYVNILGPNPVSDQDYFALIRRAMLLRSLVWQKARWLFDGAGHARIDAGVLRAMIKVPTYKHGTRSMEAIIDMSMLKDRRSFEQAALPPKRAAGPAHEWQDVLLAARTRCAVWRRAREHREGHS